MNEGKENVRPGERGDSLLNSRSNRNNLTDGVIHELKNLFNPIFSYPDIISEQLAADSSLILPVTRIQDAAARAYELIQNYIVLTSAYDATLEPMDINSAVVFYLKSVGFKYLAGIYPGVEVERDFTNDLPQFKGSPIHISCLIMNLIRNGFEAIGEKGKLRISTFQREIEPPALKSVPVGEYVVLNISDSGNGFSEQQLAGLLDEMSSGKLSYKSSSGLGLAVISEVVKSHQGYIDIRSKLDEGTVFSLYLNIN